MQVKIKRKNNRAVFAVMLIGAIAGLFASNLLQSPNIKAKTLEQNTNEVLDVRFAGE
ncbi:MAG: hypothetical protein Q4F60_01625 [Candidatus Saccharibacteria bacterium]|nr:hypothetical protein [Candidatus Saccharibacteria bacterium]